MELPSDAELLAEYATRHSEAAFGLLVERYMALVYSAARRQVNDAHLAEEITQAVFIILARKAGSLGARTVLPGWLCRTAFFAARDAMKMERRRQQREQLAAMNLETDTEQTRREELAAWQQLAPQLDEVVAGLCEADRNALVLRFYEQRPLTEVGAALGLSADAAHKRVHRALEKLRACFAKRGVTLTATLIAAAVTANSVQAAPVTLTKTVSVVAAAKGAAAGTSTLTLVDTTMKSMKWMRLKFVMGCSLAVLLVAGVATTLLAQREGQAGADTGPGGTMAEIPYKLLDDSCQFTDSFDQTKLVVRTIIGSPDRNVRTEEIHLAIQSTNGGAIPVKLGSKGQILDFPHDEALRRENPFVVSDVPRGKLGMGVWCFLPMPAALTFQYNVLSDAVAEANLGVARANRKIQADYHGQFDPIKTHVRGVVFVFPKSSAGKARLEIAAAAGKKEFLADAHGQISVIISAALQQENPVVTVSEKPQWIALHEWPWGSEMF